MRSRRSEGAGWRGGNRFHDDAGAFRNEPAPVLRAQAERSGRMLPLHEDGLRKVLAGVTSLDEILRVSAVE